MKKSLFILLSILLLTSGCGKYGNLKLPPQDKKENTQTKK
jgi:predicted small lipoprotein YifL